MQNISEMEEEIDFFKFNSKSKVFIRNYSNSDFLNFFFFKLIKLDLALKMYLALLPGSSV